MINILVGAFNLWLAWQMAGLVSFNYSRGNVITARIDTVAGFINAFFGVANIIFGVLA